MKLVKINTRLFAEDVREIKKIAKEKGCPWQIELRLVVRRAMKEREIDIIAPVPQRKEPA